MKESNYIQRAIDDLKNAHCKFEILERMTLFSGIHGYASAVENRLRGSKVNQKSEVNQTEVTMCIPTQYHIMMECQLLQHVNTQITDTIEQLETIEAIEMVGEDYATEYMLIQKREPIVGRRQCYRVIHSRDYSSLTTSTKNQNSATVLRLCHHIVYLPQWLSLC